MSILGFFLVGSLAACLGLAVALAFARAALYANGLPELDDAHRISRRLHPKRARRGPSVVRIRQDEDETRPIRPKGACPVVQPRGSA